uniref:Beta-1,3-glucan phosphorylase n=1 Tax=Euglena gracilis TaxID=3039 RepID=A0A8D4WWT7_EUGGR|nr:beta-1,3-glucan phosphorylase [Euglena gracilis]
MAAAPALRVGDGWYKAPAGPPEGEYVSRLGEEWYRIDNYDQMPPFFMSIVSPSNFWLYLSTTGGLTCGRVSAEHALFPYYTVDKIRDSSTNTGPCTLVHATRGGETFLWQPFLPQPRLYQTTRAIYKTVSGDKVEFEEVNHDLKLRFSYMWSTTEEFGFVRKCVLTNLSNDDVAIRILDGMQNILPAGVNTTLQNIKSCLVDAYKLTELDPTVQLGIFCLYALPWDRAEPKESLKANTMFHRGLPAPVVLLSTRQLDRFRAGHPAQAEARIRGQRGAFFVQSEFSLKGQAEQRWVLVAEVEQNHRSIAALRQKLTASTADQVLAAITEGEKAAGVSLRNFIAAADGLQLTKSVGTTAHHFANVMFNSMRGGIFDSNYVVHRDAFGAFVRTWNKPLATQQKGWLSALPEALPSSELLAQAKATGDPDLVRLALEYLPITFSRRHGDPSRPWNTFSICLRDAAGNKVLGYQGNWRDIFQNWEALCMSYPNFLPSMIAKFVNATTADGYNPYRVSNDGIDWETVEPHDPWSYIGYWGDHQIVYLLRFLESLRRFDPSALEELLHKEIFAYANVPYIIRPYNEIVKNPKDTIVFAHTRHADLMALAKTMGSDGKLLLDGHGKVLRVNLVEKLLVSLLAKLSNFVLDGGIWLNTQRPEWNDANNALVGNGISMVTTFHLRRWLTFVIAELQAIKGETKLSAEVSVWFDGIKKVFAENEGILGGAVSASQRRAMLDALGEAASVYRGILYEKGLSGAKVAVPTASVVEFLQSALKFVDHTIRANKTPEGLYHSYNLLVLGPGSADIKHLYLMLEGQVCALSSGLITGQEAVEMLRHLRDSALYRADQDSYTLYPDREVPPFLARNVIPAPRLALPGLKFVLDHGLQSIAYVDAEGVGRFGDTLSNADDLLAALDKLQDSHPGVDAHRAELAETFEAVFDHKAFTGRSGTMFSYEGLGCIYWHMCAKLALAVSELCAAAEGTADHVALRDKYYELRKGLGGFNKSPAVYGAFPADPYSHTPAHAGAKQPGMTGQVKEEILTRFAELGVTISDGKLAFAPTILRQSEFLAEPAEFVYVDLRARQLTIPLKAGELAFTYCQVPVVYRIGDTPGVTLTSASQGEVAVPGNQLDRHWSSQLFGRTGDVVSITVVVPSAVLF